MSLLESYTWVWFTVYPDFWRDSLSLLWSLKASSLACVEMPDTEPLRFKFHQISPSATGFHPVLPVGEWHEMFVHVIKHGTLSKPLDTAWLVWWKQLEPA